MERPTKLLFITQKIHEQDENLDKLDQKCVDINDIFTKKSEDIERTIEQLS